MEYECEHCDKVFNTNAGLYTHKEKYHKAPTVVLVNHNEHEPSTSFDRTASPRNTHKPISDDDNSEISFGHPQPYRKRKVIVDDDDDDDDFQIKKRKYNVTPENDLIPPTPTNNTNDGYKKMYFKCLNQSKKLKSEHKKLQQKYEKLQRECEEKISQYRENLEKTNEEHRKYSIGIEEVTSSSRVRL